MPETLNPKNSTPEGEAANSLVFLGGINYDQARNEHVGKALIDMAGYASVITLVDGSPDPKYDDTAVFEYEGGHKQELPTKLAMKQLNDPAVVRYTKLHERRARELIDAIEQKGQGPVDAVFQSVDTSTGILAMHQRPDLFKHVVLVDPSSIVKHPTKGSFFRESIKSGGVFGMLSRPKPKKQSDLFEHSLTPFESYQRMKKTTQFGNMNATYLSAQAQLLHEIAQSASAPIISVLSSRFDHAYAPSKILESLADINDITTLFISNSRHGIAGKTEKLLQISELLKSSSASLSEKVQFAEQIPKKYQTKIRAFIAKLTSN